MRWSEDWGGIQRAVCGRCGRRAGSVLPRLNGRGWTALSDRGERVSQVAAGEVDLARAAAVARHDCRSG